jgi:signal transduction histidine kinase
VKRVKKSCVCSVKNTGQGIPPKDLPYVFDRFYRSDAARSGEDNSYGLGLPIAKSVAEQIGGEITAHSAEHEWAEFVFTWQ